MRIFCAFECKLLEFQQLFLLSCAAHPNCSFLLFNGGRLLNKIIHVTIAFGGLSHCSWKRGKIIVQFLTALMRLRRVFFKPVMVKLVRTDHTSDPLFTEMLAANNFKQTWAGVNRLLE